MELPKIVKRKGISPLIATLLLIAIAVAASVLTYSWVMSMIGSQSAQAQTQVRIDSVKFNSSDAFYPMLRNTGSTSATMESVGIRTNQAGSSFEYVTLTPASAYAFDVGVARSITVNPTMSLALNTSYIIRVTTTTGFYYEAVFVTPSAWT